MHRRPTTYLLALGIVALLVVGVALVGCGGGDDTTTTAASTATTTGGPDTTPMSGGTTVTGDKYTFAEDNPVASNQHQMAFSYGKQAMSGLLGAEFITADANITPAKQVADIETFIQQKVDGISTWTLDQGAATAVYKKAQDAGINVVTENSPGDYVTTVFVQEQNVTHKAQKDAAEWFNSVYPGGKVLIIGGEPVPYILYVSHNMELEAEAVGLNVLERQDNMQDDAAGSQKIVESLLTKYPDVQAIWAFNDRSALGASAALRAAGKKIYNAAKPEDGAVMVTGMNGTQEAIEAVQSGVISATYSGDSELVGAAEIELLYRIKTGQISGDQIPKVIVCPYHRIDGTNVSQAVMPLQNPIQLNVLDKFLNYSTDPTTIDDFLAFVKTL
ncbi:MAG: sugar ABC transporter substrate-binding protein [Thermoleophilia bacterium]|nr:sugar ABC transporter substrate-binding protein [Thermoleophilia bacterium]